MTIINDVTTDLKNDLKELLAKAGAKLEELDLAVKAHIVGSETDIKNAIDSRYVSTKDRIINWFKSKL